jgi:drug/metabolite transporter (DMT)-like permease
MSSSTTTTTTTKSLTNKIFQHPLSTSTPNNIVVSTTEQQHNHHQNGTSIKYTPLSTSEPSTNQQSIPIAKVISSKNVQDDPSTLSSFSTIAQHSKIIIGIVGYSLCSSSLLLLNKMAVYHLPNVSFVLLCQFIFSVVVVKFCSMCGWLELQPIEWNTVKRFYGVSLLFACCLFTNVKALQYANVETLIVFRALSPIAVTVADYMFLDMELPSLRSWISLISIVAGAVAYVHFDGQFRMQSYVWVLAYFFSIVSEMVFVKYIITEVKMGTWDRVYLNNMLSIIPVIIFGMVFDDPNAVLHHSWDEFSIIFLTLSSVVAIGISYTGFHLRAMVTATSFTVVGVVNKIATTALNFFVWDQHADILGIVSLLFCILGGAFYQQASPRKSSTTAASAAASAASTASASVEGSSNNHSVDNHSVSPKSNGEISPTTKNKSHIVLENGGHSHKISPDVVITGTDNDDIEKGDADNKQ